MLLEFRERAPGNSAFGDMSMNSPLKLCTGRARVPLTDFATLQEAVLAWGRLPPEQKIRATVKVIGGPVYTAHEIDRLHYNPKSALS